MSQPVGYEYKSRIPTLSDDATIVEALKVYHYGVDDWSTEPIPDDSIEGNFRSLNEDVATLTSTISALGTTYVEQVSLSATPNIITGQSTTTVPITVRAIASQTSALQQWQNSSSVNIGSIGTGGNLNIAGYITVGSTTQSATTGVNVVIGNASHIGVAVKAQSAQTANIQEWQNNSGTAVSWVDKDGKIFSESVNIVTSLASKFPLNVATSPQTASYILAIGDAQDVVEMNVATANTLTIPPNSGSGGVAFPVGTSIFVIQTGVGQTTITAGAGVTVNSFLGLKIIGRWAGCTLIKRATNTWVAVGGLVA
jgi:hypothetical protein